MRPYPRGFVSGLGLGLFAALQFFPYLPPDASSVPRHALSIVGLAVAIVAEATSTLRPRRREVEK